MNLKREVFLTMAKKGSVQFIGLGEAPPVMSEMVDNDQILQELKKRDIDTRGKTGKDIENLVGIKTRYHSQGLSSFDLAYDASLAACKDAEIKTNYFSRNKLQLVHSGGSSPDDVYPPCACKLQGILGALDCEARDISAACSSWLDGILLAASRMRDKKFRYGLVASGEVVGSRMNTPTSLDYSLWGDGGGAIVLEFNQNGNSHYGIIGDKAISDGQFAYWTRSVGVGTHPDHFGKKPNSSMEGHAKDIHRYAIKEIPPRIIALLDEEGIEEEYPYLLPHNANLSMVRAIGKKINVREDRVLTRIAEHGNTSSASIPGTLAHYANQGKFKKGDLLILVAFGSGMIIDILLYRWP